MSSAPRDLVHNVVLYSPRPERRTAVRSAVGRRPAADLGRINWLECATYDEVIAQVDNGDVAVAVLDGEAQPVGGMGLSRQMKYELDNCPSVVVVIARRDDRWLATWSLADATISYPVDPIVAGETIAEQLRNRVAGIPVLR
ncbi:hypothetical protein CLV47_11087 [Antricoccus suffuscus]|uniref:Response regulatory domain-containing protein n=1 Tax=Antricoccus suffuscus TaxID=1629062 RepID=A0A2T0ZYE1_9ACTN|nr:hypothetical protein [Antricoccus suffuscus]PRZ41360.1 hypothetical protein CLV47_11087 [Antricoccus suffuscus]